MHHAPPQTANWIDAQATLLHVDPDLLTDCVQGRQKRLAERRRWYFSDAGPWATLPAEVRASINAKTFDAAYYAVTSRSVYLPHAQAAEPASSPADSLTNGAQHSVKARPQWTRRGKKRRKGGKYSGSSDVDVGIVPFFDMLNHGPLQGTERRVEDGATTPMHQSAVRSLATAGPACVPRCSSVELMSVDQAMRTTNMSRTERKSVQDCFDPGDLVLVSTAESHECTELLTCYADEAVLNRKPPTRTLAPSTTERPPATEPKLARTPEAMPTRRHAHESNKGTSDDVFQVYEAEVFKSRMLLQWGIPLAD